MRVAISPLLAAKILVKGGAAWALLATDAAGVLLNLSNDATGRSHWLFGCLWKPRHKAERSIVDVPISFRLF